MKQQLYAFFVLVFLVACNNGNRKDEPAGGPCIFDYNKKPLIVMRVWPSSGDKKLYDIVFKWLKDTASDTADTLSYYKINGMLVTEERLKNDSIKAGVVCTFVSRATVSGSCAGSESISLEKYK